MSDTCEIYLKGIRPREKILVRYKMETLSYSIKS